MFVAASLLYHSLATT